MTAVTVTELDGEDYRQAWTRFDAASPAFADLLVG